MSEEWHLWDSRVFLSDWRTVGSKQFSFLDLRELQTSHVLSWDI